MFNEQIAVILVNYNGRAFNDACIRSLLDSTLAPKLTIIIVDNASTDGSLEALYHTWKHHPQIQILPLGENTGFSKANNEGIRLALTQDCSYFLLLNNDTEVTPDAIEQMLLLQQSTHGIVVPKILYEAHRDTIWCAGGHFSRIIKKPVQDGLNQPAHTCKQDRSCTFANGCCMLFTSEILNKIGFLDERFFLYYEDTEFSLRANKAQIPITYSSQALIFHKVNGSTKGNSSSLNAYYITRNWLLCNDIHFGGTIRYVLFLIYFVFNRMAWILIWLFSNKPQLSAAVFRGIIDFHNKRFGKYELK